MDSKKNIAELKQMVKAFCEDRDWDQFHSAKELAIGISTEAAELLSHFRFKSETEIESLFKDSNKKEKITEEMADVLWFLVRLSQRYDIDLTEALENKAAKNAKNYPIEKAKGTNRKYTEL